MEKDVEILIFKALSLKELDLSSFEALKRKLSRNHHNGCFSNIKILNSYRHLVKNKKIRANKIFEDLLKKQKTRTLSGIASISVLTKPYPCPGKCIYCPDEKNIPKSYLSNEPAVMRAVLTHFDPSLQIHARLDSLHLTGHPTDKIELIVMGGSFNYLPENYQEQFIARCFKACNDHQFSEKSYSGNKNSIYEVGKILSANPDFSLPKVTIDLEKEKKTNENARHRIVGLTLETRPDLINKIETVRMRRLGATRIELGVQSIDDQILKFNRRGHLVKDTIKATQLLKSAGFKINYHLMPNLPGSNIKKDLEMFKTIFSDQRFQPDMIKIYPCVLTRDSELIKLYNSGDYQPYSDQELINLLIEIKKIIPPNVRIMRLGRDIPANNIIAGNKLSNIRQELQAIMKKNNFRCRCIRCREIKNTSYQMSNIKLRRKDYSASGGKEIFLSYINAKNDKLLAFLRLYIPAFHFNGKKHFISVLQSSAIIREVHSYGQLIPVKKRERGAVQHSGLGKKLIFEAEKIAKKYFGLNKISVISGVGVRGYYRKLGYRLQDEYMVKIL